MGHTTTKAPLDSLNNTEASIINDLEIQVLVLKHQLARKDAENKEQLARTHKETAELQQRVKHLQGKRQTANQNFAKCMKNYNVLKCEMEKKVPRKDIETSISCPVCFEPTQDAVIIRFCGHTFCEGCLTEWLSIKKECPTCRVAVINAPAPNYAAREVKKLLDTIYID
ncbi:E3 ubiquitin ligase [Paramarasmius palmivorus]|uniref:E3 ubiquitin ligase n=1 Tax=Paramarasmius palmivorus TaxID=297713 RepID=A0AAW0BRS0_9AGAR